jgi:streptogramin lyase
MLRKYLIVLVMSLTPASAADSQNAPSRAGSTPQADGRITEFPLTNPGSGPTTIAIAPDGALWFAQSAGNKIAYMHFR